MEALLLPNTPVQHTTISSYTYLWVIYPCLNFYKRKGAMAKKTYILDTNVYLTDPHCLTAYTVNDIVVPLPVLEEIDKHKHRQDSVGVNARTTVRKLDSLREKGSLLTGTRIGKRKGMLYVKQCSPEDIPSNLDNKLNDNKIIGVALKEIKDNPNKKIIVVSRDINMRVKCDSLGVTCEDFAKSNLVESVDYVYTGFHTHLVDDQVVERFYSNEKIYIDKDEVKLYPNQFIMLVSSSNEKKTALAQFKTYADPLSSVKDYSQKSSTIWGVKPRNKEQNFALSLLLNPEIPVISLIGRAGSGKTLLAIAAGLQQVLDEGQMARYKKLIVSRPIQPMGKDIGYLPGTIEEKMSPWLAPIQDNLESLMGDKCALDMYVQRGIIEIEALTYIRGRSINDAYIIIDEAQNLTTHELKTILTRVGENTKIVLTGDVEQIDNVYLDEVSNGLTHAIEKLKEYELSGHVTLLKGERSKIATLAAKVL